MYLTVLLQNLVQMYAELSILRERPKGLRARDMSMYIPILYIFRMKYYRLPVSLSLPFDGGILKQLWLIWQ